MGGAEDCWTALSAATARCGGGNWFRGEIEGLPISMGPCSKHLLALLLPPFSLFSPCPSISPQSASQSASTPHCVHFLSTTSLSLVSFIFSHALFSVLFHTSSPILGPYATLPSSLHLASVPSLLVYLQPPLSFPCSVLSCVSVQPPRSLCLTSAVCHIKINY